MGGTKETHENLLCASLLSASLLSFVSYSSYNNTGGTRNCPHWTEEEVELSCAKWDPEVTQ